MVNTESRASIFTLILLADTCTHKAALGEGVLLMMLTKGELVMLNTTRADVASMPTNAIWHRLTTCAPMLSPDAGLWALPPTLSRDRAVSTRR